MKPIFRNFSRLILVLFACNQLAGCGGGDTASTSATTAAVTQSSRTFSLAQSRTPRSVLPPKGSSSSASGDFICTDPSRQTNSAWINTTAYTFKFSATSGSPATPSAVSTILPGATYQNINGMTMSIAVYDSAGQTLLYTTTATLWCNTDSSNLYSYFVDNGYKIKWDYYTYQNNQSYQNLSINLAPPVITNTGWSNGMGNSLSTATTGNSFWGIDYGDETNPARWSVTSGAIYQLNQGVAYNGGTNYGSRAFPVALGTDYAASPGPGGAKDGLWQIDIKAGTTGLSIS
jgi:hypothetical protein